MVGTGVGSSICIDEAPPAQEQDSGPFDAPMLMMLHCCQQDADVIAAVTRLDAVADEKSFVAVYERGRTLAARPPGSRPVDRPDLPLIALAAHTALRCHAPHRAA